MVSCMCFVVLVCVDGSLYAEQFLGLILMVSFASCVVLMSVDSFLCVEQFVGKKLFVGLACCVVFMFVDGLLNVGWKLTVTFACRVVLVSLYG